MRVYTIYGIILMSWAKAHEHPLEMAMGNAKTTVATKPTKAPDGGCARRCARCSRPCKQAGNVTVVSCDKYVRAAPGSPSA